MTSGECSRHGSPHCMCYMKIHEHTWNALWCRPNSTCKESAKHLPAAKTSAHASRHIHCQTGQITSGFTTMKRLDQGHLHPKLEVPRLTCPGREANLGLHGGRQALLKRAIQTACYLFGTSTYIYKAKIYRRISINTLWQPTTILLSYSIWRIVEL